MIKFKCNSFSRNPVNRLKGFFVTLNNIKTTDLTRLASHYNCWAKACQWSIKYFTVKHYLKPHSIKKTWNVSTKICMIKSKKYLTSGLVSCVYQQKQYVTLNRSTMNRHASLHVLPGQSYNALGRGSLLFVLEINFIDNITLFWKKKMMHISEIVEQF